MSYENIGWVHGVDVGLPALRTFYINTNSIPVLLFWILKWEQINTRNMSHLLCQSAIRLSSYEAFCKCLTSMQWLSALRPFYVYTNSILVLLFLLLKWEQINTRKISYCLHPSDVWLSSYNYFGKCSTSARRLPSLRRNSILLKFSNKLITQYVSSHVS